MSELNTSRPCISMNYIKAEARLNFSINMPSCCKIIKNMEYFDSVKYSEKLEIIKCTGKYKVMLFSDSLISLYPVEDSETAYHELTFMAKKLFEARTCSKFNEIVSNCDHKRGCSSECQVDLQNFDYLKKL